MSRENQYSSAVQRAEQTDKINFKLRLKEAKRMDLQTLYTVLFLYVAYSNLLFFSCVFFIMFVLLMSDAGKCFSK